MRPHAHNYAHLVFSLQGKIIQSCRKHTLHLKPASLVFLPQGELHATQFQEGVRTFEIELSAMWEERVRQTSAALNTPLDFDQGVPVWLAKRLYREFMNRDNLSPLMLEGLTLELLGVMLRHSPHVDSTGSTESYPPHWLRQVRDLLHDRFTENLSLDEIAAAVGVHPSHLMAVFRQHYHCAIGDYIRRLRVEYAAHLLCASAMPASHIAFAAGFTDQSHFCRTFKRFTGMTPTEFRKVAG